MKMLSILVMLVMSVSSFASSETKTFFYDGSQDSVELLLQAEKTHTEYRYEQRSSICYRQQVFYRTICQGNPRGGRVCRSVPEYRTVSYPCIQTVRVGYEVKDYDVDADVKINVINGSALPAGEAFNVTLNGDELSLAVVGSKKFIAVLKKSNVQSSMSGAVKLVKGSYTAELVEAAPVLKALDITNISMSDSVVNFKMGPIAELGLIGFKLNVTKAPIVGSNTVLFDRELNTVEFQLNTNAENSDIGVDLKRIGVELTSGRFTITSTAFFKTQGSVLNASQFDSLEASRTLIYKIR